jgi:hypothetical protein
MAADVIGSRTSSWRMQLSPLGHADQSPPQHIFRQVPSAQNSP